MVCPLHPIFSWTLPDHLLQLLHLLLPFQLPLPQRPLQQPPLQLDALAPVQHMQHVSARAQRSNSRRVWSLGETSGGAFRIQSCHQNPSRITIDPPASSLPPLPLFSWPAVGYKLPFLLCFLHRPQFPFVALGHDSWIASYWRPSV